MDEDAFWKLALEDPARIREPPKDGPSSLQDEDNDTVRARSRGPDHCPEQRWVRVPYDPSAPSAILKLRTFDNDVGHVGEILWPASSLLCAFLCERKQIVRGKRVLEVGAGVGLLGMCCALLGAEHVLSTDYLPDVLENLAFNVRINDLEGKVDVAAFDWTNLVHNSDSIDWLEGPPWSAVGGLGQQGEVEETSRGAELLRTFKPDLVVGSALVYSDNGAVLADAIHAALWTAGRALVLQMRERIGFDRFLLRVKELGDVCELSEISEALYDRVRVAMQRRELELGDCEASVGTACAMPPRQSFVLCTVQSG